MNDFDREMLLDLIKDWNDTQILVYIQAQYNRIENAEAIIRELKREYKKRVRKTKKPLDTGDRSGT